MTRTGGGALTLSEDDRGPRRTSIGRLVALPARRCPRGRWLGGRASGDRLLHTRRSVRCGRPVSPSPGPRPNQQHRRDHGHRDSSWPTTARAATIAIATAIQESKVRNIADGDRDSVGLFQQRPSQGGARSSRSAEPGKYPPTPSMTPLSGPGRTPISRTGGKRSADGTAYAQTRARRRHGSVLGRPPARGCRPRRQRRQRIRCRRPISQDHGLRPGGG